MSKNIFLILLFIWSCGLKAQEWELPISVGYYAPFFTQIGGKISTNHQLKEWKTKTETNKERINSLSVSPQFAYFVRLKVDKNYLFNGEISIITQKKKGKYYSKLALGLGYVYSIETLGGSINLGTGEFTEDTRNYGYFLPTLGYELGRIPKNKLGYYIKPFFGRKVVSNAEDAAFFGLELGINYTLTNKK